MLALYGACAAVAAASPAAIRAGRAARRGVSAPLTAIARRSAKSPLPATAAPAPARKDPRAAARAKSGPVIPSPFLQFDGASLNDNLPFYEDVSPPPNPSGSVGPNHYLQAINLVFRVFDKDGNTLLGPLPTASLWTGFGGVCETESAASPLVRYDQLADRWVVAQSAYDPSDASVHECFAVSVDPDPTHAYYLYDFPLAGTAQAGTARLGLWPDGYYVTFNQVDGFDPAGIGIYAFDRTAMLSGSDAGSVYADTGTTVTLWGLPADLDGSNPPVQGAPSVIAALGHPSLDGSPAPTIHLWTFHPNFQDPPSSTLVGPTDLEQDDFGLLDCGSPTQGCVPQLGTEQLLQATPNRLMYRMPYRNFGDHDALVATFTVDAGGGQAAPKWLELRDPAGASPTIHQQAIYAPDASHRFVPSIALDQGGEIVLGYNKSDATIHPSVAATGRLPGDPLGTMGDESVFFEGSGSQPPVVGSWGAYSGLSIDPVDSCGMWLTAEYIGDPAPFSQYTRVAAFQLPACFNEPHGSLQGTVTDSASGQPIADAHVGLSFGAQTVTDAAGHYQFLVLPIGTFDVTVTKFGYVPGTATGVQITADQTTTQDFALAPAPTALLNGVVKDGSGGGWPLYARVTVSAPGFGSATLFTDPVTGYYGITLVAGVSYTLSTQAVVPGYQPDVRTVLFGAAALAPEVVQHIPLTADAAACSAPGYSLAVDGLEERFDAGVLPPGWQTVENAGGIGWTIHTGAEPCGLFAGNQTGGTGAFALVDSFCQGEISEDAELITPSIDATAFSSVQIRFDQDFNGGSAAFGEIADVDVSTNGGTSWTNVLRQTAGVAGPNAQSVDVTALAAGQPDVRARFHYYNAFDALWWQVDDVVLGRTSCQAGSGGLVVGNVFDANTGAGLNGALLVKGSGESSTHTFATPDDPAQADGLYVLYSDAAGQLVSASQTGYADQTRPITVVPGAAQRLDFHLDAGSLQASPASLASRVDPGGTDSLTLTLVNGGGLEATYGILELDVPPTPGTPPTSGFADSEMRARALARLTRPDLANALSAKGLGPLPGGPPAARRLAAGNVVNAYPTGLEAAWGVAFDADDGNLWISNSFLFSGDNHEYEYHTDGTPTGESIDDSSWIADWAADGAYDPRRQRIWRINVGGDGCVYEIDQTTFTVPGNRICPAFGTSQRGLAYDPITDTFYSGSWNDGVIQHFDPAGTILDTAYVGIAVSGLAFDSSTGRLYALANHDVLLGYDVYVLDPRNHYAVVGAFSVTNGGAPVLSPNGQAGMELGCDGHLWLIDFATQTLYEVDAGATGACDVLEIPWLSEDPQAQTVQPHSSQDVVCAFNSAGLAPGLRQGILRVITNTPYSVAPVPVSLTVRFADVPDTNLFNPFIYAAAGAGVMPGCDAGAFQFCPTSQVTRADMAGFILRAVHGPSFVPTPYAGAFADVHAGDYNADYIQSFSDEGYTVGCGGGNFCPTAVHTRAQTSVFILKGVFGTSYVPPACTGIFADVPCSSPFAPWIESLYDLGITAGCGGENFCPDVGIPNQQMAVFLVKAFGIPHL